MDLNALAAHAHAIAIAHGWYDGPKRGLPELIALMHSELSEALEAYRNHEPLDWQPSGNGAIAIHGAPQSVGIELADCIIRILDACAYLGIDIQAAIDAKMAYNETRPYRHGGKRA